MTRERYQELLSRLDQEVIGMGDQVASTIEACVNALQSQDATEAQTLIDADNLIDARRYEIENQALLLIATQQPLAGDLRTVASILTIATELERIGDYCEGIAKLTLRMVAEPIHPPLHDIREMSLKTQRLLLQALQAFQDRDLGAAGRVWLGDDEIDDLYAQVFRQTILEMSADKASVRVGTYVLWIAHNLERMADRVTNIAERVAFVVTGDIATFRDHLIRETLPT